MSERDIESESDTERTIACNINKINLKCVTYFARTRRSGTEINIKPPGLNTLLHSAVRKSKKINNDKKKFRTNFC